MPGNAVFLRSGDAWGDVDATAIQRGMIRRTIKEHLDKEKCLRPLAVQVLRGLCRFVWKRTRGVWCEGEVMSRADAVRA